MQLVTTANEALDAIDRLQHELKKSPELARRLGQAHAFYINDDVDHGTRFGFSKWCGYRDLDAKKYLLEAKARSGTNTEHALSAFFEELRPDSKLYKSYYAKLTNWLALYDKVPRKGVRLMALKPECRSEDREENEDRRLLELIICVSELLPPQQLHELRARL